MLPRISNNDVTIARTTVSGGAGTIVSGWIPFYKYMEILAKVNTGIVAVSVDAQLLQAQDDVGTGSKAIPTKQISQITTSDQFVEIELQQDEKDLIDVAGGFKFVALEIVAGGADFVSGTIESIYQRTEDNVPTDSVADEIVRRTIS
jgi:hypothetical protein